MSRVRVVVPDAIVTFPSCPLPNVAAAQTPHLAIGPVQVVSSFVTYLLEIDGVPLVPARASYLGLS